MAVTRTIIIIYLYLKITNAVPYNVLNQLGIELRYQYMSDPDGDYLVDTWISEEARRSAELYDPYIHNGYHLFTRSNPTISQPLVLRSEGVLKTSNFDPQKKTVFLTHGWNNVPTSDFNIYMIHAYLAAEDVNVIMTDWSVGAVGEYVVAMINNIKSGQHAIEFISWLNMASGASLSNYHLVGHSLGGHQVGVIGRGLGGQVAYITCLDPAFPGWVFNPHRFRSTDGVYTEVVHTNAGVSGLVQPVGHVDIYPNGGSSMPGCYDRSCDHHRCVFYMAESIVNGGFTAVQCDSLLSALTGNCHSTNTVKLGGTRPKTGTTGIYYLKTNASPPFSLF